MPTLDSRGRRGDAKRTYRGEEEARYLVSQLNEGRMVDRDALRGIILALQELGDVKAVTRQRLVSGDQTLRQQENKIGAVNKFLRRYIARPVLRPPSPAGGGIRIRWQSTDKDVAKDADLDAALVAVRLTQEGRINSLKPCANPDCGQWLFARFSHQRFHSDDCKALFKKSDLQEKVRRREWAKDNYWKHRHKNIK